MTQKMFIRHPRSENSPFSMLNSPANIRYVYMFTYICGVSFKVKYYPVMLHLSPATRILNENPAMGFIKHRRLENSLPTMHNSLVKFQ